jgi:5-methylcytosine-specific restriction endonuclease McrA
MPDCGATVAIRSTIKSGEHKGLKVCPLCKHKVEGKTKPRKGLKPFNPKSREKRKSERAGLPEFFQNAIEELKKKPKCVNCGRRINVNYRPEMNIAHILPKSKYKSVNDHPFNKIFLCAYKDNPDGSSCHIDFDTRILDIPKMPCFTEAKKNFEKFKDEVAERGQIFRIFEEN